MIWTGFAFSRLSFYCSIIQPGLLLPGDGISITKLFRILLPVSSSLLISGTCPCFFFYPGLQPGSPCLRALNDHLPRKELSGYSSRWFLAWRLSYLHKYTLKEFSGISLKVHISVFTLRRSTDHIPKGI